MSGILKDKGDTAATLSVVKSIGDISAVAWDACAGGDNPFLSHAFLSVLEESGSVSARTGWLPQHLLLKDPAGTLIGAVPAYLKSHSWGEYVFDHSWADAYQRAGGSYYPKLQVCIPFTPVPGPRLLVRPDAPADAGDTLTRGLVALAREHRVSSLHITFPSEAEWHALGRAGFLQRLGVQYHWENAGYAAFEDFLGALAARKRKQIRKERREVLETGLEIRTLTGAEIEPQHWNAFYRFYRSTVDRKWGSAYLNRAFFELLSARMADKIVLVVAEQNRKPVAGALNFRGTDTLYGRNWGADGDYKFLHFEACYYRAIDFAIAHGLKRVEAGAQGEHKIQRGYLPAATYSLHWLADAGFTRAIENFLVRERHAIKAEMASLATLSPFRQETAEAPTPEPPAP